jgi:hypothetical protein
MYRHPYHGKNTKVNIMRNPNHLYRGRTNLTPTKQVDRVIVPIYITMFILACIPYAISILSFITK